MRIVNFGQVVDLENGHGMVNQFTVLMDGGERISVLCDEGTLSQLVDLVALAPATLTPDQPLVAAGRLKFSADLVTDNTEESDYEPYEDEGEDPGESYEADDGFSRESEPMMGAVAVEYVHAAPDAARHVQGLGGGTGHKLEDKPRRRKPVVDSDGFMVVPTARTVSADEKGNPIVPGSGVEQAPDEPDEDGTQI